jgi:hypothetical protein
MPTTEILSSATTRSAFLQSLQRSREREERREKDLEREKYIDDTSYKYDNPTVYKYDNPTVYKYETSNQYQDNNLIPQNDFQPNLSTPIMSRRRLSSTSPSKSVKSSTSTPIKPLYSATPASQSKLASHAFTMPRSSSSEEDFDRKNDQIKINNEIDFKRKYEEEFNRKTSETTISNYQTPKKQEESFNFKSFNINRSTDTDSVKDDLVSNTSTEPSDLKALIDSVVESHTLSLKNDLQNLHIELIKQSVAQQSAFRSLLETYLPLTGKLMESLKEEREENGRLKMRIEELSRRNF